MKKLPLIIGLLFLTSFVSASEYCEGWSDGYKAGVCFEKIGCVPPVPPVCPVIRYYESYDSYKDGYKRGFSEGLKKRK